MTDLKPILAKAADGEALSRAETQAAFTILMSGEATPAQIGGLLMALRVRGESVEEFVGAVSAMRAKMLPVDAPADAIDIVGTGGDASGSYNVSTASAIAAAGAGLTVAKHGNRSLSSKSGAADVLTALGVNIELSPDQITDCIEQARLGFMFAPAHHSAMRHVGAARVELGTRTIFNLLGPMCNPAGVKRQLLGVFSPKWLITIAEVLGELGSQKVWVVYGDQMDEMTVTGTTQVAALENGSIRTFEIEPGEVGLATHPKSEILGGDAQVNAAAMRAVLEGKPSAYRDMVLLNAGSALVVADQADDIREGVTLVAKAIDSGQALAALETLVKVSNQGLDNR